MKPANPENAPLDKIPQGWRLIYDSEYRKNIPCRVWSDPESEGEFSLDIDKRPSYHEYTYITPDLPDNGQSWRSHNVGAHQPSGMDVVDLDVVFRHGQVMSNVRLNPSSWTHDQGVAFYRLHATRFPNDTTEKPIPMTSPTLSQLADIGAKASSKLRVGGTNITVAKILESYEGDRPAREAFAKAVLDAVGYKLPVDPEREAFEAWYSSDPTMPADERELAFEAFKAGRANLRQCLQEEYKMPPSYGGVDLLASATTKPTPETFEANGLTWFKHTPGDLCPVNGSCRIQIITSGDETETAKAVGFEWSFGGSQFDIIGWRYPTQN